MDELRGNDSRDLEYGPMLADAAPTRLEPLGAEALRSGLAAFITPAPNSELEQVPLEQLRFAHSSFRRASLESGLEELSEAIRKQGFVGALIGRRRGKIVELAFGERRIEAAKRAGLKNVPVQLRELDDDTMFELALQESFMGSQLTALEEALIFKKMLDDNKYSISSIASCCARSTAQVAESLLLVQFSEIEEALLAGRIDAETAKALAKIDNKVMRTRLLHTAMALETGHTMPARFIVAFPGYELPEGEEPEINSEDTPQGESATQLWGANGKNKKAGKKNPAILEAQYSILEVLVNNFVSELKKQELSALGEDEEWRKKSRRLLKSLEAAIEIEAKQLKA